MNEHVITVIIAEDMEPLRRLYRSVINDDPQMSVIGNVGSGADAVVQTVSLHPDIVLMDIEMEEKDSGLKATEEIFEQMGENAPKIIILTVYEEDELIFDAFQLGVTDYILKNASPGELLSGIRNAYYHHVPLRPELSGKILKEFRRARSYETSFLYALNLISSLTEAEIEILLLLMDGKSRRQICEMRHVEMSTVKTQIRNILHKFDKKSIHDVTALVDKMKLRPFLIREKG